MCSADDVVFQRERCNQEISLAACILVAGGAPLSSRQLGHRRSLTHISQEQGLPLLIEGVDPCKCSLFTKNLSRTQQECIEVCSRG